MPQRHLGECVIAALEREIPLEERFIKLSQPGDFPRVILDQIPALYKTWKVLLR